MQLNTLAGTHIRLRFPTAGFNPLRGITLLSPQEERSQATAGGKSRLQTPSSFAAAWCMCFRPDSKKFVTTASSTTGCKEKPENHFHHTGISKIPAALYQSVNGRTTENRMALWYPDLLCMWTFNNATAWQESCSFLIIPCNPYRFSKGLPWKVCEAYLKFRKKEGFALRNVDF